jgi:hypothetical protein
MRRRPNERPQDAGRRFESFWAKIFGVKPTPGSGNGWRVKLDVADGSIIWSCKYTIHRSITITKELLHEAQDAAHNNGDNSIPGIAIALDDGDMVIVAMEASDFIRLLTTDSGPYIKPTKADEKRLRAGIPAILREDSDDQQ